MKIFILLNLNNNLDQVIPGIVVSIIAVVLAEILIKLSKRTYNYFSLYYRVKNELNPYIPFSGVHNYCKYYVQTKFQNKSPDLEEELKLSNENSTAKNELIPYFMDIAFNHKKVVYKYYIVLAGSGMGKTTFLVNFFITYKLSLRTKNTNHIKYFPLGDSNALEKISKISEEDAKKTILLLDGLDEDPFIINNNEGYKGDEAFRKHLDDIIENVKDFKIVVLTSRTQFFPDHDQEWGLKVRRFDDPEGFHILSKSYISPFDDKDIRTFLNKKYGYISIINIKNKLRAKQIVENSPNLMVRPMLLSYIDLLLKHSNQFKYSFEIYQILIEQWIVREANKRKQKEYREEFKNDLNTFSKLVALEIYNNFSKNERLFLTNDEVDIIIKNNEIKNLKEYEAKGHSLITRDNVLSWKFAHKSIYEYLIAVEAYNNVTFSEKINYRGLDMAEQFYFSMILKNDTIPLLMNREVRGRYTTKDNSNERDIKFLKENEVPLINRLITNDLAEDRREFIPLRYLKGIEHPQDGLNSLVIGDRYAGGIVFHLDISKKHGLVCTEKDIGRYGWDCGNKFIKEAQDHKIGAGRTNTLAILEKCNSINSAAYACNKLLLNGYNDWYLPSIDELESMQKKLPNKFKSYAYRSSTDYNSEIAWIYFKDFGKCNLNLYPKKYSYLVRAIRSF